MSSSKRSKSEPLLWSMFGAGGTVAALLLPIHMLVLAIVVPTGIASGAMSFEAMSALWGNPIVRIYFFVLLTLPFFHAAHRLRFLLTDMKMHAFGPVIAVVCYGASALVAGAALFLMFADFVL